MSDTWYTWQGDTLILRLHVQPNTGENRINGILSNRLKIKLNTPPAGGKANNQLCKLLAEEFGTSKTQVEIIHVNSVKKTIAVHFPEKRPPWFDDLIRTGGTTTKIHN